MSTDKKVTWAIDLFMANAEAFAVLASSIFEILKTWGCQK